MSAPEEDFLSWLNSEGVLKQWPLELDAPAASGLTLLQDAVATIDTQSLALLQEDYNNLFILPGSSVPVWESVWTTKEKLLFGDPTFEVREAYARYGLAAPLTNKEPDDHLGLELAFLAHVLGRTAQALDSGETEEAKAHVADARAFADEHLCRWAKACLDDIHGKANTDFYKGAAVLGMHTVDALREIVAD
ncbi:MAG: molecular chaperone TorD family protein [Desulfovibrionaceae bacterium]